jgi:hypothetical protein
MEPHRQAWTSEAEAAIRGLRDIEDARIVVDADGVSAIHVISSSHRPPKQIVRDIESLISARFQRNIDHRVVSVAFTDEPHAAPIARPIELRPPAVPAAAPEPLEDRVRFGSVNLFVAGPRTQAQVEVRWKGALRNGSASGWSTREGSFRLIAEATLAAVQEFVDDEVGLGLAEIEFVRMGRQEVVVVGLSLLAHRQEKLLVGSCAVEQDAQQAVALATLGALNRVLGGLRMKEPTEFVLRPSSAQEASGAKRS